MLYRHYETQVIYEMVNDDVMNVDTKQTNVLYRDSVTGRLYTRAKAAFFDNATLPDGRVVPKYEKVS